jgi:hypothetical protein
MICWVWIKSSRPPAGERRAAGRESHHHGETPREDHTRQVGACGRHQESEMLDHGGWWGL